MPKKITARSLLGNISNASAVDIINAVKAVASDLSSQLDRVSVTYDVDSFALALIEQGIIIDDAVLLLLKNFYDTARAADLVTNKAVTKVLGEIFILNESLSFAVGRIVNDTTLIPDTLRFDIEKSIADTSAANDLFVKLLDKARQDIVQIPDSKVFDITKPRSDTTAAADAVTNNPNKQPSDTLGIPEDPNFDVSKAITETARGTDAVSKGPNKQPSDTARGTDDDTAQFNKLAEFATVRGTDTTAKAPSKALTDTARGTDDSTRQVGKNPSDTVGIPEDPNFDVSKTLTETARGTDAIGKDVVRGTTADTAAASDSDTLTFGKNLDDTSSVTESAIKTIVKGISDFVSLSEGLGVFGAVDISFANAEANISNVVDVFSRVVTYNRTFADTSRGTDTSTRQVGKNPSDTARGTDADPDFTVGKNTTDTARGTDVTTKQPSLSLSSARGGNRYTGTFSGGEFILNVGFYSATSHLLETSAPTSAAWLGVKTFEVGETGVIISSGREYPFTVVSWIDEPTRELLRITANINDAPDIYNMTIVVRPTSIQSSIRSNDSDPTLTVGKNPSDTSSVNEDPNFTVGKNPSDTARGSDSDTLAFEKRLGNVYQAVANDNLLNEYLNVPYDIQEFLSQVVLFLSSDPNIARATDTISQKQVGKSTTDTARGTDTITQKQVGKSTTDTARGTDTITDKQFTKGGITDTARGTDAFSRVMTYVRTAADTARGTDSVSVNPNKQPSDTARATDSFSRVVSFSKNYADTARGTDAFSRVVQYSKNYTDTARGTDTLANTLNFYAGGDQAYTQTDFTGIDYMQDMGLLPSYRSDSLFNGYQINWTTLANDILQAVVGNPVYVALFTTPTINGRRLGDFNNNGTVQSFDALIVNKIGNKPFDIITDDIPPGAYDWAMNYVLPYMVQNIASYSAYLTLNGSTFTPARKADITRVSDTISNTPNKQPSDTARGTDSFSRTVTYSKFAGNSTALPGIIGNYNTNSYITSGNIGYIYGALNTSKHTLASDGNVYGVDAYSTSINQSSNIETRLGPTNTLAYAISGLAFSPVATQLSDLQNWNGSWYAVGIDSLSNYRIWRNSSSTPITGTWSVVYSSGTTSLGTLSQTTGALACTRGTASVVTTTDGTNWTSTSTAPYTIQRITSPTELGGGTAWVGVSLNGNLFYNTNAVPSTGWTQNANLASLQNQATIIFDPTFNCYYAIDDDSKRIWKYSTVSAVPTLFNDATSSSLSWFNNNNISSNGTVSGNITVYQTGFVKGNELILFGIITELITFNRHFIVTRVNTSNGNLIDHYSYGNHSGAISTLGSRISKISNKYIVPNAFYSPVISDIPADTVKPAEVPVKTVSLTMGGESTYTDLDVAGVGNIPLEIAQYYNRRNYQSAFIETYNFAPNTSGPTGPTNLSSVTWSSSETLSPTVTNGYISFVVPSTRYYTFNITGAAGGVFTGNPPQTPAAPTINGFKRAPGARVVGKVLLTQGQTVTMVIGQGGGDESFFNNPGGGGGTFVTLGTYANVVAGTDTLLFAAGGGGGGGGTGPNDNYSAGIGQSSTSGGSVNGAGGDNGNGAPSQLDDNSTGGGGYLTSANGSVTANFGGVAQNGFSGGFRQGSVGSRNSGVVGTAVGYGGFGGGGSGSSQPATDNDKGGGGGYSGGGYAFDANVYGGGGGSYAIASATDVVITAGNGTTYNGSVNVIIQNTLLSPSSNTYIRSDRVGMGDAKAITLVKAASGEARTKQTEFTPINYTQDLLQIIQPDL